MFRLQASLRLLRLLLVQRRLRSVKLAGFQDKKVELRPSVGCSSICLWWPTISGGGSGGRHRGRSKTRCRGSADRARRPGAALHTRFAAARNRPEAARKAHNIPAPRGRRSSTAYHPWSGWHNQTLM